MISRDPSMSRDGFRARARAHRVVNASAPNSWCQNMSSINLSEQNFSHTMKSHSSSYFFQSFDSLHGKLSSLLQNGLSNWKPSAHNSSFSFLLKSLKDICPIRRKFSTIPACLTMIAHPEKHRIYNKKAKILAKVVSKRFYMALLFVCCSLEKRGKFKFVENFLRIG